MTTFAEGATSSTTHEGYESHTDKDDTYSYNGDYSLKLDDGEIVRIYEETDLSGKTITIKGKVYVEHAGDILVISSSTLYTNGGSGSGSGKGHVYDEAGWHEFSKVLSFEETTNAIYHQVSLSTGSNSPVWVDDLTITVTEGVEVATAELDVLSFTDYYAFGMAMGGRKHNTPEYRYGFNGAEKEDEWTNSSGDVYDLGLRCYDSRLGRMFSRDPREHEYAWQSTYAYYANSPISTVDLLGGGGPKGKGTQEGQKKVVQTGTKDVEVYDNGRHGGKTTYNVGVYTAYYWHDGSTYSYKETPIYDETGKQIGVHVEEEGYQEGWYAEEEYMDVLSEQFEAVEYFRHGTPDRQIGLLKGRDLHSDANGVFSAWLKTHVNSTNNIGQRYYEQEDGSIESAFGNGFASGRLVPVYPFYDALTLGLGKLISKGSGTVIKFAVKKIKNTTVKVTVKGFGCGLGGVSVRVGRKFAKDEAVIHFTKHSTGIMNALNKKSYNIVQYLDDANHVIKNGTFVPEMNAYIKLIGGKGSAKYAFVGLNRTTGQITTFHIKTVKEIARKAPSLGLQTIKF